MCTCTFNYLNRSNERLEKNVCLKLKYFAIQALIAQKIWLESKAQCQG